MDPVNSKGWIGVDLNGTLAEYMPWKDGKLAGRMLAPMKYRVQKWLAQGYEVRIFTARADEQKTIVAVQEWLTANGLPALAVTNVKDRYMVELWDDRVVQVEPNTGMPVRKSKSRVADIQ